MSDHPCARCGEPSLVGLSGDRLCAWHFDEALQERRAFAEELLRMLQRVCYEEPSGPLLFGPEPEEIRHPALCGEDPA